MGALWLDDRLLGRALIASLVLHLIFAYFIPSLTAFQGVGPTIETISFVKMVRLTIQRPRPVPNVRVAEAPKHAAVVNVTKDAHTAGTSPAPHQTATVTTRENRAVTTSATTQSGVAVSVDAKATATPTHDQTQTVASTQTRQQTGGFMPLGASDVPVLDPGVLRQLQSLGVHVTLTINVDENGKTTNVSFDPQLASSVEDSIRSALASAEWDPAYCGAGIPCAAKVTIKL